MAKRILITGGASGLGKALAKLYVARGDRVLITDIHRERGEQTLRELGGLAGELHFLPADTTSDRDWESLHSWVRSTWGGLDILINNAGVSSAGRIDKTSIEDWNWILEINLKGVIRGVRTFVPMMKRQGSGHIVNMASLAAIANLPTMSSYNVTKAGVVSLSETLRAELAPYGIYTTVVCPAFVATNLGESLRTSEADLEATAQKLIREGKMSADEVARRVARAVEKRRFLELPQVEGKVLYLLKRLAPGLWRYLVARGAQRVRAEVEPEVTNGAGDPLPAPPRMPG